MTNRGFVSTMRIVRNQAELTGGMVKPSAGLLTVDFDVPLTMAGARVHRVAATLLVTTDHEALKRGQIKVVIIRETRATDVAR